MTPTTRKIVIAAAAMAAVLAIASPTRRPHPRKTEAAPAAAVDEIIVGLQPGVSGARLREDLAARGLSLRGRITHTNVVSVATNGREPAAAIRSLDDAAKVLTRPRITCVARWRSRTILTWARRWPTSTRSG